MSKDKNEKLEQQLKELQSKNVKPEIQEAIKKRLKEVNQTINK